jgi:hypothetical protein
MRRLAELTPDAEGKFTATLQVAKELLKHHADEMESKILPLVIQSFSEEERVPMVGRIRQLKEHHRDRMVRQRKVSGPAGIARKGLGAAATHR